MHRCDRCGTGFGAIQAAVLEFCPRCRARDQVLIPLIVRRVTDPEALTIEKAPGHERPPEGISHDFAEDPD